MKPDDVDYGVMLQWLRSYDLVRSLVEYLTIKWDGRVVSLRSQSALRAAMRKAEGVKAKTAEFEVAEQAQAAQLQLSGVGGDKYPIGRICYQPCQLHKANDFDYYHECRRCHAHGLRRVALKAKPPSTLTRTLVGPLL